MIQITINDHSENIIHEIAGLLLREKLILDADIGQKTRLKKPLKLQLKLL